MKHDLSANKLSINRSSVENEEKSKTNDKVKIFRIRFVLWKIL